MKKYGGFILFSYVEGLLYALMVATVESFALLKAAKEGLGALEFGLVATVPILLGALAQWVIPMRVPTARVRHMLHGGFAIQCAGLLGLFWISYEPFTLFGLLVTLSLYWIGGMVSLPFWLDWMSAQLPRSVFRSFLSKRNSFVMLWITTFYLAAAALLESFPGITIHHLFLVGFCARLLGSITQWVLVTPPRGAHLEGERRLEVTPSAAKPLGKSYVRLLMAMFIFTALFKFGASMASPFFIPYMLDELRLSLNDYVLLTAIPLLGRTLFLEGWGRASYGFRPFLGLQISMFMAAIVPSLWLLSDSKTYLALLELFSGIFWAGFDLSVILVVQYLVRDHLRKQVGMHMAMMNVCAVLGAFLGGRVLEADHHYSQLFHLSTTLRLGVAIAFGAYILRWNVLRFNLPVYRDFLTTVLSLRPSLANVSRIIFPPRRKRARRSGRRA